MAEFYDVQNPSILLARDEPFTHRSGFGKMSGNDKYSCYNIPSNSISEARNIQTNNKNE